MPRFGPAAVHCEHRPGGGIVLRSAVPLAEPVRCLGDMLVRWAREAPDRTFFAERRAANTGRDGWRRVSYQQALASVRGLAQTILDAGLGPTRPLAIASGNSIEHALLALAAMHVGVPVAAISPAYSLMSQDHARLRDLIQTLAPGAVWAESAVYDRALATLDVPRLDARAVTPGPDVERAFAAIDGNTVAKILFTSGSTGTPKGVVNTHRMLCANQVALAAGWPFVTDAPPVIVDWLPWSHTFGANQLQHDPREWRNAVHRWRQAGAGRVRCDARELA